MTGLRLTSVNWLLSTANTWTADQTFVAKALVSGGATSYLSVGVDVGGTNAPITARAAVHGDYYVTTRNTDSTDNTSRTGFTAQTPSGLLSLRNINSGNAQVFADTQSLDLAGANVTGLTLSATAVTAALPVTINGGTLGAASTASFETITGTWNDAGTTFKGALLVNVTKTNAAVGSLIADFQIGGSTVASVRQDGRITSAGSMTSNSSTAIPAGGTAGIGYMMSSVANFGVFFGSGAPSLSAAQGSLYLRSDGTTVNNRMYVNTNGSTTWTAVTTVG